MRPLSPLPKKLNFKFFLFIGGLVFFSSCYSVQQSRLQFQAPLKKATLTQKYKPYKKKPHLGIDLRATRGTPVLSIERGRVVYAGRQFTGYGKVIMIEHDSSWTSLYAHLNSVEVSLGQKIQKGQKIGTVGNTGRSTGTHLHLELFYKKRNINPLKHIPIKK